MKAKKLLTSLLVLGLLAGLVASAAAQSRGPDPDAPSASVSTAFHYQGELQDADGPVDGNCDLRFRLWTAAGGGSQVGSTVTLTGVAVAGGLFTAELDFGASAFQGDARWLEAGVRCPAGSGSYTWLTPRHPLVASPYALYALRAPWDGLSGVPPGLDDGDDNATYSAGTGLTLSGTDFSLRAAYRLPQGCANGQIAEWNGSAWACADDDAGGGGAHNHLGETWNGSNNPLVIDGSFGTPDAAPVILANDQATGDGLRVSEVGDDGLQVDSAGGDGLFVDLAGDDGVNVFKAGNPSDHSASNEHNGFEVAGAEGHGLHVGRAYMDGVHVYKAGNPTRTIGSLRSSGVEVEGAQGSGLFIGWAGEDGVHVSTTERDGVRVSYADRDGVHVFRAGNPADSVEFFGHCGFEVEGAEAHGLRVGWAGGDGVEVNSAGTDGLSVDTAGGSGLHVSRAGNDGVHVYNAGKPASTHDSGRNDGVVVEGAEGDGMYVGWAGDDGLHVYEAVDEGVRVTTAGDIGVYANTSQADNEWGFYTPDKIHVGTSVSSGGPSMIVAQNGDSGGLETGDVVTVSGIGAAPGGGEFPVPQVRRASAGTGAVAGVVYRRFSSEGEAKEIGGDGPEEQGASAEWYSSAGPIAPGDHLLIVVLGAAQVKVDAAGGSLSSGDLLAAASGGRARSLDGSAPDPGAIVGQAMGFLEGARDSGIVWVLVNPH